MVSGYPTSTSIPRVDELSTDPRVLGRHIISSQAIVFLVEGDRNNNVLNKIPILLNIEEDITPKTYKEDLASRDSSFWKEAINDEIDFFTIKWYMGST